MLSLRVGAKQERLEDVLLLQTMGPSDKRPWLRARQIDAFKQILGYVPAANIFNAMIIVLACAHTGALGIVAVWAVVVCGFASLPMLRARGRPVDLKRDQRSIGAIWRAIRDAALLALAWAALPVLIFPAATAEMRTIISVVMAGMMCGAGFMLATIAPAAIVFSAIICIGGILALSLSDFNQVVLLTLLLLCYVFVIQACVIWIQRLFIDQLLAQAAAAEKTQVIGLLLKDFEQASSDWLWKTDAGGRIQNPSTRFAEAVGVAQDRLSGLPLAALCANDDAGRNLAARLAACKPFRDVTVPVLAYGQRRWLSLTGKPEIDGHGFQGVASDVTDVREAADQVAFLAHNDSLTGLPNRVSLQQKLDLGLTQQPGAPARTTALMLIDIDEFKRVNDAMGHPAGDSLLLQLSARLKSGLPDAAMVARLSGDEFAILFAGETGHADIEDQAQLILALMAAPFDVNGSSIYTGVSIGVRLIGDLDSDGSEILRQADLALYAAKTAGRRRYRLFSADMEVTAQERRVLEADLQEAIERGEFYLVAQPIWDARTGQLSGCEALLRWDHPRRGPLSPTLFIQIAEQCGLIEQIGAWVLREALGIARQLPGNLPVAVNISPKQLQNANFAAMVINALAASNVPPERLELEITESALFSGSDTDTKALHQVASMGVRIALDDFGTGFSSLSHLRLFPFDKIKIDRSFIAQIVEREDCRAIVRAVCDMARSLDIRTVAEGVETEEQMTLVQAVGCDEIQGYLLSRPVALDKLEQAIGGRLSRASGRASGSSA